MPGPATGSFDYWRGGRVLATRLQSMGRFDYWRGGRPLVAQSTGQTVSPVADVAIGSWTTDTGGTTNLFVAVDEVGAPNDADYIQSSLAPVADLVKMELGKPGLPASGPWTLVVRHKKV